MTILDKQFYTDCWDHWCKKRHLPFVVGNKMPIPYFGDIAAYMQSDIRVVTVGLNPNRDIFEDTACNGRLDPEETELRLSSYFAKRKAAREWPGWFSNYEHVLSAMGHSFLSSSRGALHVDLCSPLATDPTWSKLKKLYPDLISELLGPGRKLFARLYEILKPDIAIVSVAGEHLDALWGNPSGEPWQTLVQFPLREDGLTARAKPYDVKYRLRERREAAPALIIFGEAANKPFGTISRRQQKQVGESIRVSVVRYFETDGCLT